MKILPLAYLPSVQWFAVYFNADKILIERYDSFTKQTFRNRTRILSPNGVQTLIVPVLDGRSNKKIPYRNVRIDYSHKWISKHLNSIKTAYGSAPFFEFYFEPISQIIKQKIERLYDLNLALLERIFAMLDCEVKFSFTKHFMSDDEVKNNGFEDFRFLINKKASIAAQLPKYPQVFEDKFGFSQNLSILDLLFNLGPESLVYLKKVKF